MKDELPNIKQKKVFKPQRVGYTSDGIKRRYIDITERFINSSDYEDMQDQQLRRSLEKLM